MELKRADYMIIAALLLFFVAHWTTNTIIGIRHDVATQMEYSEQAVILVEANPLAKLSITSKGVSHMFTWILLPAVLGSFYWFIRRKYSHDVAMLELFGILFLVAAFADATNDVSILIGMLL